MTLYHICRALEPNFLNKLIGIHTASALPYEKNNTSVLDAFYAGIGDDLQFSLQSISMKDYVKLSLPFSNKGIANLIHTFFVISNAHFKYAKRFECMFLLFKMIVSRMKG